MNKSPSLTHRNTAGPAKETPTSETHSPYTVSQEEMKINIIFLIQIIFEDEVPNLVKVFRKGIKVLK